MADTDPSSTLAEMSASLTLLEAALEPLLAKPFDQVRDGLDPLQKARLEVMSGYVVHDLIWSESSCHTLARSTQQSV